MILISSVQTNTASRTASQPPANRQPAATPNELNTLKALKERKISPDQIIEQVVSYLNVKTDSNFKSATYTTQTLILDRINEGFTLDDFKAVIKKKTGQWIDDARMAGNLAPTTLFAGDKFEKYLQEAKRNGNSKPKEKRKPSGIELMALGYDILSKFGGNKFNEWCQANSLPDSDANAIRWKYQRESQTGND